MRVKTISMTAKLAKLGLCQSAGCVFVCVCVCVGVCVVGGGGGA